MTAMMHDQLLQECLRNCTECHSVCLKTSVEKNVAGNISAADLTLLVNCAEMCRTSADFMLTGSAFHPKVCGVCAEICTACADMCERSNIDVMRRCAETCRTCADSCRRMGAMM